MKAANKPGINDVHKKGSSAKVPQNQDGASPPPHSQSTASTRPAQPPFTGIGSLKPTPQSDGSAGLPEDCRGGWKKFRRRDPVHFPPAFQRARLLLPKQEGNRLASSSARPVEGTVVMAPVLEGAPVGRARAADGIAGRRIAPGRSAAYHSSGNPGVDTPDRRASSARAPLRRPDGLDRDPGPRAGCRRVRQAAARGDSTQLRKRIQLSAGGRGAASTIRSCRAAAAGASRHLVGRMPGTMSARALMCARL